MDILARVTAAPTLSIKYDDHDDDEGEDEDEDEREDEDEDESEDEDKGRGGCGMVYTAIGSDPSLLLNSSTLPYVLPSRNTPSYFDVTYKIH